MSVQEYTIKTSAELMRLLSSGLYQHKTFAVVRELATNALDAIKENEGEVVLKLYGDDANGYWFQVSDTGPGLTAKETIALMSSYGNSTKINNAKVNGKFGVGSKAPFAYANEFYISSSKNGEKHYFRCYKDDSGIPYIQHLKSEPSDQTGLDFRIKIKKEDITDFFYDAALFTALQEKNEKIHFIAQLKTNLKHLPYYSPWNRQHAKIGVIKVHHEIEPMLNGPFHNSRSIRDYKKIEFALIDSIINQLADDHQDIDHYDIKREFSNGIFKRERWKHVFYPDEILRLRVGNVEYSIEDIKDFKFKFNKTLYFNRVFVFDPKEISLTGSRESVELTKSNITVIQKRLDEFTKIIEELIESDKSLIDRLAAGEQKALQLIDLIKRDVSDEYLHIYFSTYKDLLTYPQDRIFNYSIILKNNEIDTVSFKIPDSARVCNDAKDSVIRYFDAGHNRVVGINELLFQKNEKHVFCIFSRKKVDTQKILNKYKGNVQLYFTNNDNLETIIAAKKLVKDLQKINWISDRMEVLDVNDIAEFKRTFTRKTSDKSRQNYEIYKYFDDEATLQQQFDPELKTFYYFIHRNEMYLAKFIDSSYQFDEKITKYAKVISSSAILTPKRYFNWADIAKVLTAHGYQQAVIFKTKKEMLKFLKANNITIDLEKDLEEFYTGLFNKFPELVTIHNLACTYNKIYSSLYYQRVSAIEQLLDIFDPVNEKDMRLTLQNYAKFFIDISRNVYASCIPDDIKRNAVIDKKNKIVRALNLWEFYYSNIRDQISFTNLWNLYELVTGNTDIGISKEIIDKINIFKGANFVL